MKKILLATAAFSVLFGASADAGEVKPYISAKLGASFFDTKAHGESEDFDNGVLDLAVGARINSALRAEIAFAYRGGEEDETTVYAPAYQKVTLEPTSYSFMANAYYDVDTKTKLTPYLTVGAGVAKVKYEIKYEGVLNGTESASKASFAYSVGAGVSYKLNENGYIDIGYRYVDLGSFKDDGDKIETKANEVLIGVRYEF